MEQAGFRARVVEVADRVESRTGIDPLDLTRAMSATTDARLELLPQSVGIGCALLAVAIGAMCFGFIAAPEAGPGDGVTAGFAVVDVLLFAAVAACLVIARVARARRPHHELYEDAWARFAVELWPAPRYQSFDGTPGTAAAYSRVEFLLAMHRGADLGPFRSHAPFLRLP